jgi:excisionase family DNA binding protein
VVRYRVEEESMASRTHESESLLTPAEVASMFRVDPKTVTRWAKADKLSAIRTLGGHRRYPPLTTGSPTVGCCQPMNALSSA